MNFFTLKKVNTPAQMKMCHFQMVNNITVFS